MVIASAPEPVHVRVLWRHNRVAVCRMGERPWPDALNQCQRAAPGGFPATR